MPGERRAPVNKWAVAVAVAVALAFLYIVRLAVVPFLIAAAIAYVAEPGNFWLRRRFNLSRGMAASITFLVVMGAFLALGYWAVASLATDFHTVISNLPQLLHKFLAELFGGEKLQLFGRTLVATTISQQIIDAVFGGLGEPTQILDVVLYGFGTITATVLVVVLLFYFLYSGPELARGTLWVVPPEYRAEVAEIAAKIDPMLRRYLVGLLVIVTFATIVSWVAIRFALQLAAPFLLALLTGLFELIPVIGPMAAATVIGLLSLEQHGLWAVVAFAVYVSAFRLMIDRVVGPVVLGRAANLHPIVVIFAFLAGGLFLGIPGVILAVPVAATVKVVLDHYYSQPTRGAG